MGAQYTGGLDRVSENEGKLALLWQNEVAQERSSACELQVALFFVAHARLAERVKAEQQQTRNG